MKVKDVEVFEKLHLQIKGIYSELCVLSKKSPDGAINKFKLKFVNRLLIIANQILGEKYIPFSDFSKFNEDDIPTNSDVILIVSQYIRCLEMFKSENVTFKSGCCYWYLDDSKEEIETSDPDTSLYA